MRAAAGRSILVTLRDFVLAMHLNREARKQFREAGRLSTVGLELALSITLGVLGGRWLDGKLGTEPWLLWIGFGFGLAAGARSLYRVARRTHKDLQQKDDTP